MPAPNDRRIDYLEFGATDLIAIKRFYQQAFGWKFTDYGPGYAAFEDGRLTGGFRNDMPVGKSPLVVIFASDLEATQAAVAKAGAEPFNLHSFPGGRRFHFRDPSGNELAVWSDK